MKINNKIFGILIATFFIGVLFAKASDNNPYPRPRTLTNEEIVAFGTQQLDNLIRLNKANKKLGEESYNRYIFFTKNMDAPIDRVKEYVWGENYEEKSAQLEALNKKLVEINTGLTAPLYLGVNLNMGDVVSQTVLGHFSTVEKLQDLQADKDKKDLKELLVTPLTNLYTSINTDIATSVDKDQPITIHTLGFFRLFYTKGEKDKTFSSVWRTQKLIMKNFGNDERKSVIRQALLQKGIGFKVDKNKNVNQNQANGYFERYKAAVEQYWNADFVNDYTFYNVVNIEQWYQQNLDNKETGPFTVVDDKYLYDYTGLFFDFKTNLNSYLKGYTNSTKYGKPRVVITDDFTNQDRLFQINEVLNTTKKTGAFIWIHIDKNNRVVKQNIYRNGNKIQLDPALATRLENYGNILFSKGFSSKKALVLLAEMDAILTQFGSVVFNGLTDGINTIKIPNEFWDSASKNYYFKEINELVADVVGIEQLVIELQNDIAFISGVYNGFIGTLSFITGTAAAGFDTKIFINKVLTDKGYRDDLLQQADRVMTFLKDDTSRDVAWLLTKTLVLSRAEKAWDYQWGKIESGNLTGVNYLAGNITFEIVIATLTLGVSAEATIGKEFLAVLKWAIDPFEFVIKAGAKFVAPVARLMAKGCKIATDGVVSLGGKILFRLDINARLIKRVGQEFLNSLDKTKYSTVFALELPEGIGIHNGIKELENRILKIVSDTNGAYRVVVEELGNLETLANQLKDGFNITSINKAKQLVEKLGADNVSKLLQKADIINKADGDVVRLLDDIADTPDFAKHIDDLTEDIIAAWRNVFNAKGAKSAFKRDYILLKKIASLKENKVFIDRIGGEKGLEAIIKNNVRAPCKTCKGGSKYLKDMDEYLDDVAHFVNNFYDIPDGNRLLKELKNGAQNTLEGGAYVVRVFKENANGLFSKSNVSEIDLRFSDKVLNRFDVKFANGFAEFKSYQIESVSNISVKQLKQYLSDPSLTNLEDLYYMFDKRKLLNEFELGKFDDIDAAINGVKNQMRKVFESNAKEIFEANPMIFDQIEISPNNYIDTWAKLKSISQNSDLFNSLLSDKFININ